MSLLERLERMSPRRLALLVLDLQARLESAERARSPIAIIGMACRFPGGVETPEDFWQLLRDGRNAIAEIPRTRWDVDAYYDPNPEAPGKMYVRQGGFLSDVERFDAAFFGISPREATSMDPQQRLLLEVAWESLERSGYNPASLKGSRTGVFVGITNNDYRAVVSAGGVDYADGYTITGNSLNFAAGRLSYALGLQGPSLALDSACSASLSAVHMACGSLRAGECDLALAGGVNLILEPSGMVLLSKAQMLSPTAACRTFDAAADGYARSEGCGLVVLKRLSASLADRDCILAVIRGTAMNQDGRSSGITVPNGRAQEALIKEALRDARLEPKDVGYVEAHGTGTKVGDPIELRALTAALADGRSTPLMLGSVKTNIGHAESAAGISGLMKAVLALQHREIPPHLHLRELNPDIALDPSRIVIPTRTTSWRAERRVAGVSAFGASGTNVHVVLEEAPAVGPPDATTDRPVHVLTVSGRTDAALTQMAERWAGRLEAGDIRFEDFCFTANTGRTHFAHRIAIVSRSASEAAALLRAVSAAVPSATNAVAKGHVRGVERARPTFVFGAGAPDAATVRRLYETQPTFRRALNANGEMLAERGGGASCIDRLRDGGIEDAAAVVAIQLALVELWKSWGIEPSAVTGESYGTYAAACAAGIVTQHDALRLAAASEPVPRAQPQLQFVSGPTAIETLVAGGQRLFLEIGRGSVQAGTRRPINDTVWISPFDGHDGWTGLLRALACLYVEGCGVDWVGFDRDYGRRRVVLPTYAFQRERYWIDAASGSESAQATLAQDAHLQSHVIEWREQTERAAGAIDGAWLIVGSGGALGAVLRDKFESSGALLVGVDSDANKDAIDRIWREQTATMADPFRGIVHLASLDIETPDVADLMATERGACGSLLNVVQTLAAASAQPRLWVVTRGSQPVGDAPVHAVQSPAWGLGGTIASEHPEWRTVRVDLDPSGGDGAERLWDELQMDGREDRVAFRDGRRYVARFVRREHTASPPLPIRRAGCYLITGGLGAIGLEAARWLANRGARHLVLIGRNGPTEQASAAIAVCQTAGARVDVLSADVSRADDVARVLAHVDASTSPLAGIIHAAGVLQDGVLEQQTWSSFERVLAPKMLGGWHLHRQTADRQLDFFVMFSSTSAVFGSAGQGNYASANTFLDALAHERRRAGLPALSVNWGPWAVGLTTRVAGVHHERWAAAGVRLLEAETAFQALERAMSGNSAPQVALIDIDWRRFGAANPGVSAFVRDLVVATASAASAPPMSRGDILNADAAARRQLVVDFCTRELAAVLRVKRLAVDQSLSEFGFDSLMAMEIRNRIQRGLTVTLPLATFLGEVTVGEIAVAVLEGIEQSAPLAPPAVGTGQIGAAEARRLLDRVGDLSDAEVDAVLAALGAEK